MNDFMKVYLAGGTKSGWQELVKSALRDTDVLFLDPRMNGFKDPVLYTAWDMQAIRGSGIVFAYLEKYNPSGLGLAAEIGYAKGLGYPVVFVNERHEDPYTHFLEAMAGMYFETLPAGIEDLKHLLTHIQYSEILWTPSKLFTD
jgi:nucleoside 2-deoxyribosyltransferase